MFSNMWVAILFALGASTWVYSQVYRRTGGNNQSALVVTAFAAIFAFLFMLTLLGLFFS